MLPNTALHGRILHMQTDEKLVSKSQPQPRQAPTVCNIVSALVSFACIIHVISTNYLGFALSKCQYLVELMDTGQHHFPPTHQLLYTAVSLHPDVSSSISNTAELWLFIFVTTSKEEFDLNAK